MVVFLLAGLLACPKGDHPAVNRAIVTSSTIANFLNHGIKRKINYMHTY